MAGVEVAGLVTVCVLDRVTVEAVGYRSPVEEAVGTVTVRVRTEPGVLLPPHPVRTAKSAARLHRASRARIAPEYRPGRRSGASGVESRSTAVAQFRDPHGCVAVALKRSAHEGKPRIPIARREDVLAVGR